MMLNLIGHIFDSFEHVRQKAKHMFPMTTLGTTRLDERTIASSLLCRAMYYRKIGKVLCLCNSDRVVRFFNLILPRNWLVKIRIIVRK